MQEVPFPPHPLQHLFLVDFFDDGYFVWCEVIPNNSFVCLLLITSDVELSFTCLLTICVSSLEYFLLISYDHFMIGMFVFMILS